MTMLSKYLAMLSVHDATNEKLKKLQDRQNAQQASISSLDNEYTKLHNHIAVVTDPTTVQNKSDIASLWDKIGSYEDVISDLKGKVGSLENLNTEISKIEYLYNNTIPEQKRHDSEISSNTTHIRQLSDRVANTEGVIKAMPTDLANMGFILNTDFDKTNSWFSNILKSYDVAIKTDVDSSLSTLSTEINSLSTKLTNDYMTAKDTKSYVTEHVPTTETMDKLTTLANSLPPEVNSLLDWQGHVDNLLIKDGQNILMNNGSIKLGDYLESLRETIITESESTMRFDMGIPGGVSDLYSWVKGKIMLEDFLDYIPVPSLNGMKLGTAVTASYNTSATNKIHIQNISDFLGGVLTKSTPIQAHLGNRRVRFTVSKWIDTLGRLDDSVWSHATYATKKVTDYWHTIGEIDTHIASSISSWMDANLNDRIYKEFNLSILPEYSTTIRSNGLTDMGTNMLKQHLKTTAGDIFDMSSVVDISKHISDIRTRVDTLTDTSNINPPSASKLKNYIKLVTNIDGFQRTFDTYDDFQSYIINTYRVPFLDHDGHRYKVLYPVLYKYTDVTYHPESTNTTCEEGSGSPACTTADGLSGHEVQTTTPAYWSGKDESGNNVVWRRLPAHVYWDGSTSQSGTLVSIKSWTAYSFYTKNELDDWLSNHTNVDPHIADLYQYTSDDPPGGSITVTSDADKNFTEALSAYGQKYIANQRQALIDKFQPHPVFTIIPTLTFAPGTTKDDVVSTVQSYMTTAIPDTIYDRLKHVTTNDVFASVIALPSTIGILSDNLAALSSYVSVQLANLGADIQQMIDPTELQNSLSQFGSNILSTVKADIASVTSDVADIKTKQSSNSSAIDTIKSEIATLQDDVSGVTGSIDLSAFWSRLSAFEVPGENCGFGDIFTHLTNGLTTIKNQFAGYRDSSGSITPGFAQDFNSLKIGFDGIVQKLANVNIPTLSDVQSWVSGKVSDVKASIGTFVSELPTSPAAVESWITNSKPFQSIESIKNELESFITNLWNNSVQWIHDNSGVQFSNPNGTWTDYMVGIDKSGTRYKLTEGTITTGEWAKNLKPLIGKTFDLVTTAFGSLFDTLMIKIKDIIESIYQGAKDMYEKAVDYFNNKISALSNAVVDGMHKIVNLIAGILPDGTDFDSTSAIQSIRSMTDIKSDLQSIETVIQGIQDRFSSLGSALSICST